MQSICKLNFHFPRILLQYHYSISPKIGSESMDYTSQLLAIGEGDFFVSCLLHLPPEDLKACRLVNKTWNDLIKERVWGSKRARKRLEEKLQKRWNTTNPQTLKLGNLQEEDLLEVKAIFCNNTHVFCGKDYSGKVKVFSLTDGRWIRDLESGEEDLGVLGSVAVIKGRPY